MRMTPAAVIGLLLWTISVGTCFAKETARPATVLLITNDALAESWQPFADWKTQLGKATRIVTTEQIAREYEGDDLQAKIRDCCLDHIAKHGTRWVVLGGDSEPGGGGIVPDRDTAHKNRFAQYDNIPTDIYYLSKKNWDADGDGVFGEWPQDQEAISYLNPRAVLGRIPVRTAADVAAYTEKVIGYESRYPSKDFAQGMVYTCTVPGAYAKLGTSNKVVAQAWPGTLKPFFADVTAWDKDAKGDHDLNRDHWVKLINDQQTSKMHMHGHGILPGWVLEDHKMADANQVKRLKNNDAYLAMTTVACFTGQFDDKVDPAISESMLRAPASGAVLIVAPSREGVPIFHDPRRDFPLMVREGKMDGTTETMTRFWKFGLGDNLTAGEAMREAKRAMIADAEKTAGYHYIQCELNLLGDPTLSLRVNDPREPTVDWPKKIKAGTQKLSIKTDAPGATVCCWKQGDVYQVVTADKEGLAVVDIAPKAPGEIRITVSGSDLNAVTKAVPVAAK